MGPRILILCRGYLGSHMSAPGIRATAQARVLATHVPGREGDARRYEPRLRTTG